MPPAGAPWRVPRWRGGHRPRRGTGLPSWVPAAGGSVTFPQRKVRTAAGTGLVLCPPEGLPESPVTPQARPQGTRCTSARTGVWAGPENLHS